MSDEIASAALQGLLGINKSVLSDLAARGEQASARDGETGSDACARLGAAQADLTETKARRLAGELVPADEGRAPGDLDVQGDQEPRAERHRQGARSRALSNCVS